MEEKKLVVLVIDDQPDLVEGIKFVLEQEDYEVWTAANGQLALNKLENAFKRATENNSDAKKALPDLILADIMMPVMDGYELYDKVRRNPYLNHIPFTFLTAKVDGEAIRQGKEMGVDDYLTKPCAPDDLLASVRGKLKRNEQRRAIHRQFVDDIDKTPTAGIIVLVAFIAILMIVITFTAYITMWLTG